MSAPEPVEPPVPVENDRAPSQAWGTRLLVLALLVMAAVGVLSVFGDQLSLPGLVRREADLRAFRDANLPLTLALAFVIYVAVTGMWLPGATLLTLSYGWLFGFWKTFVLVSFASTLGATIAFLTSRYLFRDWVQRRFATQLRAFNQALDEDGAFYLFGLRLVPVVPFFVINAVMGLTRLRVGTFWWVSQLGMLPGTMAYVYAGASLPDLKSLSEKGIAAIPPQLAIALGILGIMPLLFKKLVRRR